ncbi:VWA domain-containing protein [Flavobacterium sp. CYK-4]|uniref:VWA domain-containing protein n=1 Tax=Flavobacterium lotistagni TaxID=2709660 RepID=UPI00140DF414|nr:VWA domain-containing protein [Flavobacterium lotistagni]NHM07243.1 VWA domain-containing protein [Flavobacterium lotistagni]
MKALITYLIVLIFAQFSFANGVLITNRASGSRLPLINSEVNVTVQNQIATVRTSQTYINNTSVPRGIEYGFPLTSDASVTQLKWRIDNGAWQFAVFVNGGSSGGGTGTLNSSLSAYLGNTPLFFLFSNDLAANSQIEVELTYVQLLPYSFDEVTFQYPSDYSSMQSGIIQNSQIFNFQLTSGRTITSIISEGNVATITNDGNVATASISQPESTSIDNILIRYRLASDQLGVIPFSTILEEGENNCDNFGNGFFGMVVEPESNPSTAIIQKNFVLIVDSSGSMSGNKMVQAKQAATFIVNNLNVGDNFNIIDFDSSITPFRPTLVEYNPINANAALAFINNMVATGGTNISGAVTTAVNQFGAASEDQANIVVFFTDGEATSGITSTQGIITAVNNSVNQLETEIFLFTFGIGDYVTTDLLTLLATNNNGFVTFLGNDEIEDVVSNFYLTIRNPVLLNPVISVVPANAISNVFPDPLPNLYKGQQLIFTGRYQVPQDIQLTLSGTAFNQQVQYVYNLNLSNQNNPAYAFLPKLWAKNKMESLLVDFYSLPQGSAAAQAIEQSIEQTSICYQVLSPFTSLSEGPLSNEEFMADDNNSLKFFPNPFTSETKALIYLHEPAKIVVQIYSIDGKLLKTIAFDGIFGENEIKLDGLDSGNNSLGAGIYIYTVSVGGKNTHFGKLIKN